MRLEPQLSQWCDPKLDSWDQLISSNYLWMRPELPRQLIDQVDDLSLTELDTFSVVLVALQMDAITLGFHMNEVILNAR